MTHFDLLAAVLIGLAGGVHCIGMCGGIASAFSFAIPKQHPPTLYILAYNLGRILSYTLMGAALGGAVALFDVQFADAPPILPILSIVFLVLMALYISDWWRVLTHLERAGSQLWRHIAPLAKRFIPFKHPGYALVYGMLWGWLPCGLVYSALTWAMASGSAIDSGLTMLFFGLGTLPAMMATSMGAGFLVPWLQHPKVRKFIALGLLMFAADLIFSLINGTN